MKIELKGSSNLSAVAYDESKHVLFVEFKTGTAYQYHNVPKPVFDDLLKAESYGKCFAATVKGKFPYSKIPDGKIPKQPDEKPVKPDWPMKVTLISSLKKTPLQERIEAIEVEIADQRFYISLGSVFNTNDDSIKGNEGLVINGCKEAIIVHPKSDNSIVITYRPRPALAKQVKSEAS